MDGRCFDTGHGAGTARGDASTGREPEARLLRASLRAAPSLTVVRAETGAGGPDLVDGVLREPEFTRWTRLRARCADAADAMPLAPVLDALAALPYPAPLPGRPLPPV
ncbi:helix-turn-helix transcriptional regulator, partial [Streptomyces seoulensis]